MLMVGGGGGGVLKVIIIITVTWYFNVFLPVRISVHRRTRLGVATLQSVFSWAEFCFKNWAIVLRLTLNSISASLHRSYHSFYFIPLWISVHPYANDIFQCWEWHFRKPIVHKFPGEACPTILVKIHEFLCCCLMVLALTLPLSLLLFVL
jgi:hypothetical protein